MTWYKKAKRGFWTDHVPYPPKTKKCQICLDNPDMPSGGEHDADIQYKGKWMCRHCYNRAVGLPETGMECG